MRYHLPTSSSSHPALASLIGVAFPILLGIMLCPGCAGSATQPAADNEQATYESPDLAMSALFDALRTDDIQQLGKILGPASRNFISSGDEVLDSRNRKEFLALYDQRHSLQDNGAGGKTIVVGSADWPLPIPLTGGGHTWRFDTAAGRDEILNRRIGKNELSAIQVCLAVADAQQEYVRRNPNGYDEPVYAQKFFSDPGTRDGLFWETGDGEVPSPLGPLVAAAADDGYGRGGSATRPAPDQPYYGYRYRMLTSQGANAPGGAYEYIVRGKMIGGFALVAYPAEYGNSGIMTFIVNHDGAVYQKDLGADTRTAADAMTAFDPDATWTRLEKESKP